MPSGLFGKLPAKRDFIEVDTPPAFSTLWHQWLSTSIRDSRLLLGEAWQDAFLGAPIWRFWLGSAIGGNTFIGAIMPSVDGVGRYFPLTAFAFPEAGTVFAPPDIEDQEAWFDAIEPVLLDALDLDRPFEATLEKLRAVAPPGAIPADTPMSEGSASLDDLGFMRPAPEGFAGTLKALRQDIRDTHTSGESYWWTIGGGDLPAHALGVIGLPTAEIFRGMLTGSYANPAATRR